MRAKYGLFFINIISDAYFAAVTAVQYATSCFWTALVHCINSIMEIALWAFTYLSVVHSEGHPYETIKFRRNWSVKDRVNDVCNEQYFTNTVQFLITRCISDKYLRYYHSSALDRHHQYYDISDDLVISRFKASNGSVYLFMCYITFQFLCFKQSQYILV